MAYGAVIDRNNPSCFLFLIDQSTSMEDPFGASEGSSREERTRRKADAVADAINNLLYNLTLYCTKSEGVYDYYHVGVIGYGSKVGPAFTGSLSGKELAPISLIANNPARIESRPKKVSDGAGGLVEQIVKFPIWFDAVAKGGTPMGDALSEAHRVLSRWLSAHPDCYPPIAINITDGEADSDPTDAAGEVRRLTSSDGNVLLFNVHLSSDPSTPIAFPDTESRLPDAYAKTLFQMSSTLPDGMRAIAGREGFRISAETRGFVFNADIVSVIQFLDIGTRPALR